jgi:hypothetical protein
LLLLFSTSSRSLSSRSICSGSSARMSLRKVSLASCSRYLNLIFLKNSWGGSKDTRHTSYAGKYRRVSIEDGKRGTEGRAEGRRLFGTNDLSRDLLPYESRVTRVGGHRAIGEGLGEVRLGLGEELFLHRGDMELGRVKGRDDAAGERERERLGQEIFLGSSRE